MEILSNNKIATFITDFEDVMLYEDYVALLNLLSNNKKEYEAILSILEMVIDELEKKRTDKKRAMFLIKEVINKFTKVD